MDKTQIYETFEISASDAISDILKDKTLLNPVLSDELINNGTITNYTDPDYKDQLVIWQNVPFLNPQIVMVKLLMY